MAMLMKTPYTFVVRGNGLAAAPTVFSPSAASIEHNSATLGGTISSTGGDNATSRGVYWSGTSGFVPPGQGAPVGQSGSYGTGSFSISAGSLSSGSLLYFRAFATNGVGTGFSAQQAFRAEPPDRDCSAP